MDPSTWDRAAEKPLLWNGIMIYDRERKPITEKFIVGFFRSIWAVLERKGDILSLDKKATSIKTLLDRMTVNNADPNWVDHEESEPFKEEEPPKPPVGQTHGGYTFSEAQEELANGLTDEEKVSVGRIMTSGLNSNRLKQELFDHHTRVDPFFFVELYRLAAYWTAEAEESLMLDWYSSFEFDTKEEVLECFTASSYLMKRPALKKKVIEEAIRGINGYPPEEVKADVIATKLSQKAEEYNMAHGLPKMEGQPIPIDASIQKRPNSQYGPEAGKESRKKYGAAYRQAQEEFRTQGIDYPTGKTPGFRDRVQEIYEGMMDD